jgi:hypothetical protein
MQVIAESLPVTKSSNVALNKPANAAVRVLDAEGEEYVRLPAGHSTVTFQAAGAPGTHTVEALDEDGQVTDSTTFELVQG